MVITIEIPSLFKPGCWLIYIPQSLGLMAGLYQISVHRSLLRTEMPESSKERLKVVLDLFSNIEPEFL